MPKLLKGFDVEQIQCHDHAERVAAGLVVRVTKWGLHFLCQLFTLFFLLRGEFQTINASSLEAFDLKRIIEISEISANRLNLKDRFVKEIFIDEIISKFAHNFVSAAQADMHCRRHGVETRRWCLLDF